MTALRRLRRSTMTCITTAVLAGLGALGANVACAWDPVTDEMQRAYAPYRAALFRTNTGSQSDSQAAIGQAQQAWNRLVEKFATQAGSPYDRDAAFAASLAKVSAVYAKAEREIRNKQLSQAHETLEEARDILAELRRRNQVIVFSDHMNAYHAEMEHVLNDGPKFLAAADGMLQLAGSVGTLEYLARRLTTEAPAELGRNDEFIAAAKAVENSVAELKAAVLKQDAAAVKEAIGKVKGPYSRMFLKFG